MLGCIAFSKRPLKYFELLHAVALYPGNTIISHETKLWKTALDICKPFIEDGMNQTVVFIHSSVKEFILDAASGPLITPRMAHYDLAFACVAYLVSGFDLVNPESSYYHNCLSVAEGFHALHLYANAFWLEHLLDFATDSVLANDFTSPDPMTNQIRRLCTAHNDLLAQHECNSHSSIEIRVGEDERIRLESIISYADLHVLGQQFTAFQNLFRHRNFKDNDKEVPKDPTLFTCTLQSYQTIVKNLLKAKDVPQLSAESLADFKACYGPFAFVCSFRSCEFATAGFQTEKDLEKHKMIHRPKFVCGVSSCDYAVLGFTTLASQKRHFKTYHQVEASPSLRGSLHRRIPSSSQQITKADIPLLMQQREQQRVQTVQHSIRQPATAPTPQLQQPMDNSGTPFGDLGGEYSNVDPTPFDEIDILENFDFASFLPTEDDVWFGPTDDGYSFRLDGVEKTGTGDL